MTVFTPLISLNLIISVIVRLDCSSPELLLDAPARMMVAKAELELAFEMVACFW